MACDRGILPANHDLKVKVAEIWCEDSNHWAEGLTRGIHTRSSSHAAILQAQVRSHIDKMRDISSRKQASAQHVYQLGRQEVLHVLSV